MPRASDYLLEGSTYHLTHHCQNREFHLRFQAERNSCRQWLREGIGRFRVPVYAYCITKNHVHVVVHVDDPEAVAGLMHLAAGSTAKRYNLRKKHLGSVWEHPYHCTIVQDGHHLLNCLRYVDLNMVRAGVVHHPREWPWYGFDELTGERRRYRLINMERLLESLGTGDAPDEFAARHAAAIDESLAARALQREPDWTDALAVGTEEFVQRLKTCYPRRWTLNAACSHHGTWTLRDRPSPYGTIRDPKTGR